MNKMLLTGVLIAVLSACTWVKLSPEGSKVRVLSAAEVNDCKKLGKTTVSVKATVAGVARNASKVENELEILARNHARDLKGDTVVPVGQPEKGQQIFDVYRCVNP